MKKLLALLVVLLLGMQPADAQESDPANGLIGLWAAELHFGPVLRGDLTLTRGGTGWSARIMDAEHRFPVAGEEIRFSLPDGRGGFRGRFSRDNRTVEGFWVQPSGETADRRDPGGSGQPFATPLTLVQTGDDSWRGTVVPLDDRFTLYLKIFEQGGRLLGAFRNPELNANGGASQFEVTRNGDAVRFIVRYDGGEIVHDAAYQRAPERLRIAWNGFERPIELTRRTPEQAAAFFPRPPGEPPYIYRAPGPTGDGWRTAAAGDTGLDEAVLTQVVQSIIDSDPAARPPSLIHSILVAHRGRLVLEEYFFGYGRETPHDTRSAGKTFSSVMLGAAMMRGHEISPATRIHSQLAPLGPFANLDPRKAEITLAHLMTHSAGLACNDNDETSPGNEGTMSRQAAQPDWWKYTLDLPQAFDPGTRYAYCSANINLVGGALTTATRTWLPEFFRQTVAEPLQFGRWHWNVTPAGEGYLGGGAFLRPRDLLKVGQAYLNRGEWNGRRIVPAEWITESTRPRMEISPASTGYSEEEFGNYYGQGFDALAWHLNPLTVAARTVPAYAATGNGGQVLLVIPEFELAVVFTGGNYMQGGVWGRWGQQIVGDRIIPAISH
jgi:CubicO group peptidase (beta-lactamase class C family)